MKAAGNVQVELVGPGDDCMVSSRRGDIWTAFFGGYKDLPAGADALESVEVEGDEVVEEETVDLATEDVDL